MTTRNIIVMGASAGGFSALRELVRELPADLNAAIFVVWHMSPDVRGLLAEVLNREGPLPASYAVDGEKFQSGRIYVAPPDRHLILEDSRVRLTKGPKENRFRPAVDPLFRSAAYSLRERVIGVILSGSLDDGTSGLWTIKQHGGLAVIQDPADAEVPSMPENAAREVAIDHSVPIKEMGALLGRLVTTEVEVSHTDMGDEKQLETEVKIAAQDSAFESNIMQFGEFSPYACPDCHGVMTTLRDGKFERFRCHTGHAYSADSLLATLTESIEESLWNAIRGIEESIMLLNHLGEHFAEGNTSLAMLYFQKAREAQERVEAVRRTVMNHEHLSVDKLRDEAGENGHSKSIPAAGRKD
jgi:two-component system chemotaxis response regulator CheB